MANSETDENPLRASFRRTVSASCLLNGALNPSKILGSECGKKIDPEGSASSEIRRTRRAFIPSGIRRSARGSLNEFE